MVFPEMKEATSKGVFQPIQLTPKVETEAIVLGTILIIATDSLILDIQATETPRETRIFVLPAHSCAMCFQIALQTTFHLTVAKDLPRQKFNFVRFVEIKNLT